MNREIAADHTAAMFRSDLGFDAEYRPRTGGYVPVRALPVRHDVEAAMDRLPVRQDVRNIRLPTVELEMVHPDLTGLEEVARGALLVLDGVDYEVSEPPAKLEHGFTWDVRVHLR